MGFSDELAKAHKALERCVAQVVDTCGEAYDIRSRVTRREDAADVQFGVFNDIDIRHLVALLAAMKHTNEMSAQRVELHMGMGQLKFTISRNGTEYDRFRQNFAEMARDHSAIHSPTQTPIEWRESMPRLMSRVHARDKETLTSFVNGLHAHLGDILASTKHLLEGVKLVAGPDSYTVRAMLLKDAILSETHLKFVAQHPGCEKCIAWTDASAPYLAFSILRDIKHI